MLLMFPRFMVLLAALALPQAAAEQNDGDIIDLLAPVVAPAETVARLRLENAILELDKLQWQIEVLRARQQTIRAQAPGLIRALADENGITLDDYEFSQDPSRGPTFILRQPK